jgi:KUP system potassium uptake protein
VQSRGTARVAGLFGPVCALWFLVLGGLGLWHIGQFPTVLQAFNPTLGIAFLLSHGMAGFLVLGAVFLTVTGAEALIADMGHFGRRPIQLGWLALVWPALSLNYLGQGALALSALTAAETSGQAFRNADWFFLMAPEPWRFALVVLAALATIIASQAVITGAFSLTHQGMSLGLLPRMAHRQTSASQIGQIYMPGVNWMLFVAVILTVFTFQTSSAMAAAYGIAVTGTMVLTSILAFIIAWRGWKWPPALAVMVIGPFLLLDLVFFGANSLRIAQGGWLPVTVAVVIGLVIATWVRGRQVTLSRTGENGIEMRGLAKTLSERPPVRVPGVAIFLTQDPGVAPAALLHNLKHNKSLHRSNILLRVETQASPWVSPSERLRLERLDDNFTIARLRYGYMEKINVPGDLALEKGLLSGPGGASFFVGRSVFRFSSKPLLPRWMGLLYMFLHKNASDPTAYFSIPPNMVVELGGQVEL